MWGSSLETWRSPEACQLAGSRWRTPTQVPRTPGQPRSPSDEQQVELDRDQLIADLGQAVADRDQQSSDHEQERTDRERDDLSFGGPDSQTPSGRPTIRAAQERRDAHQQVLDDAQTARDREQLTYDGQQDNLVAAMIDEPLDTVMRRFQSAESRAAAAEQRAEAAIRRARQARARAAKIAELDDPVE